VKPSGESFDSPAPSSGDWTAVVAKHDAESIRISPSTAVTQWTGEALDLGIAIGWLMQKAIYTKNVSAETS
jgi:hypothetical protein